MSKLMLGSDAIAKLSAVTRETVVYDEAGKPFGLFKPVDPTMFEPKITEEELDRRSKSEGPWYTTAEVLAHLEKLK